MMRIILVGIIFLFGLGFIISILLKYALGWGLTKVNLEKERERLLQEIDMLRLKLIPFDINELELISNKYKQNKTTGVFNNVISGIFYSIYDEPVFAYGIKTYAPGSSIAVACTSENIFTYIIKQSFTKVYINHTEIGVISPEGYLHSPNQKLLAYIDQNNVRAMQSVFVYGKEVGEMANGRVAGNEANRAFVMLDRLEQDEYELFLALTLYKLLQKVD